MITEFSPSLISVIIPVYNCQDYIEETLNSILNQSYRPIELIVIDDGSTDNSVNVVRFWINCHSDDPHFMCRLFIEKNHGAPAARNLGFANQGGSTFNF